MSVSKESILAKVTHKEILEYFLREYAYNLKEGKHISNPLLSRRQKTPSFNIYYSNRSSTWRWKDFAGGDGSAFDLVMQLYNVDFPHACDIINTRMNLGIAPGTPIPARLKQDPPPDIEDRNYDYTLYEVNWSQKYTSFWARYGTGLDILKMFGWKPIQKFEAFNRYNEPYKILGSVMFAIEGNGWAKVYKPRIRGLQYKAFFYVGQKPKDYLFGHEQLPAKGKDLYLVGGEKDVTNLRSHNVYSVCLNGEESTPLNSNKFMRLIDKWNVYVMYDNDETGRKRSEAICKEVPALKPANVRLPDGWDISDYFANKYDKLMF